MLGGEGTKCWKFSKSALQWQIVRTRRNVSQINTAPESSPERIGPGRGSVTKERPGQPCPGLRDTSPVRVYLIKQSLRVSVKSPACMRYKYTPLANPLPSNFTS
jgi:hypothetical protein